MFMYIGQNRKNDKNIIKIRNPKVLLYMFGQTLSSFHWKIVKHKKKYH